MKYITGEDRNQFSMIPICFDEIIAEDNPVRVIDAYVDKLDMEELGFVRATPAKTGRPGYNPKDLLKLYIYGYMNRIRSSRRLESEASRNLEVIWLINNLKPDFKTIADFRKDNKEAIKKVFKHFTILCREWDLFGKELVAIDGSKFKAQNSKRKNYNKKKIHRNLKYIEEKINEYIKALEENDESESCDRKPTKEEIQKRIEELKARKSIYEEYKERLENEDISEISTTDPDARLMSNNNKIEVCYNVQTAVDSKHKLILVYDVINNPADQGQLYNMSNKAKKILEVEELEVLADKGYYKGSDLKKCIGNGITPYVAKQVISNGTGERDYYPDKFIYDKEKDIITCPQGQILECKRYRKIQGEKYKVYSNFEACQGCAFKDKCTKAKKGREVIRWVYQDLLDEIDKQTEKNKEKYRQRQMIVEHPFGTIKRGLDSYYLLTRGIESVSTEISLSFFTYNLKRVINILGVNKMIAKLAAI